MQQIEEQDGEQDSGAGRAVSLRGQLAPGLIWLETQRAGLLGRAAPLLVLPPGQHALATEVQRIITRPPGTQPDQATQPGHVTATADACEGFLADLGLVVRHSGAAGGAAPDLATRTARHLLAFACDAGAPSLAAFLLPAASANCSSAAELVAAVDAVESGNGSGGSTTLLHRALRSGCAQLTEGLLAWGAQRGYTWQARPCFPTSSGDTASGH
jgi:hypothetical protein